MVEIKKPDPRILIIRMSSLGDIILTAPVFRSLRAKWPGARLEILVKPQFLDAVSKSAFIDGALPFRGFFPALAAIKAAAYDAVVDLHDTPRSRLLCLFAGAPVVRYRKDSLARRLFVNFRIPSPSLEKHTLDRYLDALAPLGVEPIRSGPELGDWTQGAARPALKPGPVRICLLQTAFLGDCVLTLPLLKKIKEVLPGAAVTVVTRPETAQIFSSSSLADAIIEDHKKTAASGLAEFRRLRSELAAGGFGAAIIPHRSLRSALLARLAGIPVRVGFSSSAGSVLLTHKVPFSWLLHDVERNLALMSPLAENLKSAFPGLRQDAAAAPPFSAADKVLAGVNTGSAWPTKRWPAASWARLIRRLAARCGGRVLMVGGPGELPQSDGQDHHGGPDGSHPAAESLRFQRFRPHAHSRGAGRPRRGSVRPHHARTRIFPLRPGQRRSGDAPGVPPLRASWFPGMPARPLSLYAPLDRGRSFRSRGGQAAGRIKGTICPYL
ncbi:MAG: glycosyltransferase family 9 protein [Elusimicrobia bacterium]|nr:glycosyltransferase family 9 protein [Elusimicrobiota bacterium]